MRNIREMMIVLNGRLDPGLKRATGETIKRLDAINKDIKKMSASRSDLEKLRRQFIRTGQSTADLDGKVNGLDAQMSSARLEAENLRKTLARLEYQQGRMNRLQSAVAKNQAATTNARGQMVDAVGLAAALAMPAKKAMELESAMADVRKVVDGLEDPRKFQAMTNAVVDMTTNGKIPMAADALAQIVASGGQAGIAGRELKQFARDAAKMGVAFDISAEESGAFMASWRTSFVMNQKQVRTLADQVNYLGNTTAATAPKIAEVVTRIGPLGKVGGLASGEIAALGASMVAMGITPEIASTGIKKIITTLNAGTAVTKRQSEAFDVLGIDAIQLSKRMQKDAGGAILSVFEKLNQLPNYRRTAVLKELFGEEALAAVGALLPALDSVEKNLQKVAKRSLYAGSMQREFASRSKTSANSLQLLKNMVVAAAVKVGSVLLPELVALQDVMSPIINSAIRWAEKNPKLFRTIVRVTVGLVALRIAVLTGNYAMLVIKGGVLELALGMMRLTKVLRLAQAAQWLLNVAMGANPVGAVILAIVALGAAVYLVIRNYDKLRHASQLVWKWFVKFGTEGAGRFIPLVALIANLAKNWDKVSAAVQRAWVRLKKVASFLARNNVFALARSAAQSVSGKIKGHARGGIVSSPQLSWVGEQGREAIIPLDNHRSRAESLWKTAGQQLGLAGSGANITFAPVINISGNASKADVASALSEAKSEFARLFNQMMRDHDRRSMS